MVEQNSLWSTAVSQPHDRLGNMIDTMLFVTSSIMNFHTVYLTEC